MIRCHEVIEDGLEIRLEIFLEQNVDPASLSVKDPKMQQANRDWSDAIKQKGWIDQDERPLLALTKYHQVKRFADGSALLSYHMMPVSASRLYQ